jgi:hypothetical protein
MIPGISWMRLVNHWSITLRSNQISNYRDCLHILSKKTKILLCQMGIQNMQMLCCSNTSLAWAICRLKTHFLCSFVSLGSLAFSKSLQNKTVCAQPQRFPKFLLKQLTGYLALEESWISRYLEMIVTDRDGKKTCVYLLGWLGSCPLTWSAIQSATLGPFPDISLILAPVDIPNQPGTQISVGCSER